MKIEIDGKDLTQEIKGYYINGMKRKVCITYKQSAQREEYDLDRVIITPITHHTLSKNEIFVYKENILNVTDYFEIGDGPDKTIKIPYENHYKYYKYKNLTHETFEERILRENDLVTVCEVIKNVKTVEYSKTYARVTCFGNPTKEYYLHDDVHVKDNMNIKDNYQNLLQYYTEIAKVKDERIQDHVEKYLEKQIEQIPYIHEDSLLHLFFSGENKDIMGKSMQMIYPFGINLSQREALINALNKRISLIQGPPGTGKTQSILNIIANLIVQDKTIAVVSSNNEAVKNVLEKLEKNNYGFLVALLGRKQNKEEFFHNQKEYPLEMDDWSLSVEKMEQLLDEINHHETNLMTLLDSQNKLAQLKQQLYEYKHEYHYFLDYIENKELDKLKQFSFFHLDSHKMVQLLVDLNFTQGNINRFINKIRFLIKYGIYDLDNINSAILYVQEHYYQNKIQELTQEIENLENILNQNNYQDELNDLVEKSKTYFRAFLAYKYNQIPNRHFQINEYWRDDQFDQFVKRYPVILSSTHAIAKSKNLFYQFDYLIIDEASQVDLVPGIISLSTANNVVVVGDRNQLPHIPEEKLTQEEYQALKNQYQISDVFDYYQNSLLDAFDMLYDDSCKVLLKEHYRCHHSIIEFCNRKYYGGNLICHSHVQSQNPLILLKTSPGNHMRYGKRAVNKITNIREIHSLIDDEFIEKAKLDFDEEKTIGFIAPFRGQANKAKSILPSDFQEDTVHKFQGRECDVVMFSTVLDNTSIGNRFMNFVDEKHLINVAVSRAVKQFILVSHVDNFLKKNGEISDLIRYMQYYQEESIIHQSQVRSIFDLLYSDYSDVLKQKEKNQGWKRSKYDSENLTYELLDEIMEDYHHKYKYVREVRLKEIFTDDSLFLEEEKKYIGNNASVDIIIYNVFDKKPILAIEVDGFAFHENNPKQKYKDHLKDHIFKTGGIPLLRLETNGDSEKREITKLLP